MVADMIHVDMPLKEGASDGRRGRVVQTSILQDDVHLTSRQKGDVVFLTISRHPLGVALQFFHTVELLLKLAVLLWASSGLSFSMGFLEKMSPHREGTREGKYLGVVDHACQLLDVGLVEGQPTLLVGHFFSKDGVGSGNRERGYGRGNDL